MRRLGLRVSEGRGQKEGETIPLCIDETKVIKFERERVVSKSMWGVFVWKYINKSSCGESPLSMHKGAKKIEPD